MNFKSKSVILTLLAIALIATGTWFSFPFGKLAGKQQTSLSLHNNNRALAASGCTQEKFMTYLPHSGLHNQRISLINALVIAKALNRTLIMPQLNIGGPVAWGQSSRLSEQFEQCPSLKKSKENRNLYTKLHCYIFRSYKPVPVESIFDLSAAHYLKVKTLQRQNMNRHYYPVNSTVYYIEDSQRYTYRLYDDEEHSKLFETNEKYAYHLTLDSLRDRPELYIEFGSLFGRTRLELVEPGLVWTREHLRRAIGIQQSSVQSISSSIMEKLGGSYSSVHLRQGDGAFKEAAKKTMHTVVHELRQQLNSGNQEQNSDTTVQRQWEDDEARQKQLSTCLEAQGLKLPNFEMIYLATDAKKPRIQFKELFDEFPCVFTLDDFRGILEKHGDAKNLSYLLPMIDAEAASHANNLFIGTPDSTFSAYVRYRNQYYHALDFFSS